ncbi:MAG: hypothetical protein MJ252_08090 [archaeon]|nr:hypothetical protein [archaeon]
MKISKVAIVVLMFTYAFTRRLRIQNKNKESQTNVPHCWVKEFLSDCEKVSLENIVIPGTHDSGISLNLKEGAKQKEMTKALNKLGGVDKNTYTQYFNLREQMNIGVRFFDIRYRYNGGESNHYYKFKLHHGPIDFDSYLSQALRDAVSFLNECKEDFIIYKIKLESAKWYKVQTIFNNKAKVYERFMENMRDYDGGKSVFFKKGYIPKLYEVKGKIWIILDGEEVNEDFLELFEKNKGFLPGIWKDIAHKYTDYETFDVEEKRKEFKKFWRTTNNIIKPKNQLHICGFNAVYISGLPTLLSGVLGFGNGTQQGIVLFEEIFSPNFVSKGVIQIDWATREYVQKILKAYTLKAICQK